MVHNVNGFDIEQWNIHKFDIKGKTEGRVNCTCPFCSHNRKKKNDKCAIVNLDSAWFECYHCGERGQIHSYKKKNFEVIYTRPEKPQSNTDLLNDKILSYLTNTRGFTIEAIKHLKIRQQKEWMPQTKKEENVICFDYHLNQELINIKFRDGNKNFKLVKGAEKIFWNLDSSRTSKEVIICEGEFDVMAFVTAGHYHTISVPNGFNLHNVQLDYLDNYTEYFENKECIYIAVDNDEAGRKGQKELVRRLGADKCKIVDFEDCKDANDYLLKYGKEKLANRITVAQDVRLEGIYTVSDAKKEMLDSYRNGKRRGTTTYVPQIDKAWTWRPGEVNLWTGYQNEGKSLLLTQLCAIRAYWEDAKVAVFSPENIPLGDFYDEIIEMLIGKSADPYYKTNYMSEEEYLFGMEFCEKNFFLIYPEEDFKLESIFERTRFLIKKNGIRVLIIDPYNTVEHLLKPGEREDLYISRFMAKLKRFAIKNDISIHLVAHQNTPKENTNDGGRYYKPKLNNIKGGGTFADKADNVLTIWRPNRALNFSDSEVVFASQKIKKQKLVGRPQDITEIDFDVRANRYLFNGETPFSKIDADRKGEPEISSINFQSPSPEGIHFQNQDNEISF